MQDDIFRLSGTSLAAGSASLFVARKAPPSFLSPLEPDQEKNPFLTSGTQLDADEAIEEWIGRTETMQFHFVDCSRAPSQCEKCTRELLLHE